MPKLRDSTRRLLIDKATTPSGLQEQRGEHRVKSTSKRNADVLSRIAGIYGCLLKIGI
jgi:hypothetical protein